MENKSWRQLFTINNSQRDISLISCASAVKRRLFSDLYKEFTEDCTETHVESESKITQTLKRWSSIFV